jgi:hypothetical protein
MKTMRRMNCSDILDTVVEVVGARVDTVVEKADITETMTAVIKVMTVMTVTQTL